MPAGITTAAAAGPPGRPGLQTPLKNSRNSSLPKDTGYEKAETPSLTYGPAMPGTCAPPPPRSARWTLWSKRWCTPSQAIERKGVSTFFLSSLSLNDMAAVEPVLTESARLRRPVRRMALRLQLASGIVGADDRPEAPFFQTAVSVRAVAFGVGRIALKTPPPARSLSGQLAVVQRRATSSGASSGGWIPANIAVLSVARTERRRDRIPAAPGE